MKIISDGQKVIKTEFSQLIKIIYKRLLVRKCLVSSTKSLPVIWAFRNGIAQSSSIFCRNVVAAQTQVSSLEMPNNSARVGVGESRLGFRDMFSSSKRRP